MDFPSSAHIHLVTGSITVSTVRFNDQSFLLACMAYMATWFIRYVAVPRRGVSFRKCGAGPVDRVKVRNGGCKNVVGKKRNSHFIQKTP